MTAGMAARVPPLGAYRTKDGVVFRLWSTRAERASVVLYSHEGDHLVAELPMHPMGEGIFELTARDIDARALYRFRLDDRELPDPYARFLPHGVHGAATIEHSSFVWTAPNVAIDRAATVVYELHVGTFTPEGTYRAAISHLDHLTNLGVTAIELMPLSSFPGTRGWGYDGVAHFAPFAPYGTPDDLRQFVDACHARGLSVVLDVVYNHFGPAGNYLAAYSPQYFTDDLQTPWGAAPNYAHPYMRAYVVENALFWLTEYRFDGLRLDAIHEMPDRSTPHILEALATRVHELPGARRVVWGEDDRNSPLAITSHGLDGVWADDFHHLVHVLLTGESDGYYGCYERSVDALARTIRRGWFYEGQIWPNSGKPRGAPRGDVALEQLIDCLQNHDQVGNRAFGDRLGRAVSSEAYLSASMLLLFVPATPLLFMGQEWSATTPFCYFTDHEADLGKDIAIGRRREFEKFRAFADPARQAEIPDPQDRSTFERSKLDWSELGTARARSVLDLYRRMLNLRRTDAVLARSGDVDAFAVGPVLRVERSSGSERRTLFVNFSAAPVVCALPTGCEIILSSSPHAMLSPKASPDVNRRLAPWASVLVAEGVGTLT